MDGDRIGHQDQHPPSSDPGRARLREALLGLLGEQSYSELGLSEVLVAAALSEAQFARLYEDLDECFAELCQAFMREAAEETFAAYAAAGDWREGMRAQIWASHRFLLSDQLRARICVIDVNFGGDRALAIRDLFMNAFTELVHLGRHHHAGAAAVSRKRAEAIAGSAWERIAAPIRSGDFDLLIEVVPQILYLLYLPYLGEAEARAELTRARAEVERRRGAGG